MSESTLTLTPDNVTKRRAPHPIIYLVVGAQGCGKTTFLQKLTRSDPSQPHPPHIPYTVTNKNPRSTGRAPELHFYEDTLPWVNSTSNSTSTNATSSSSFSSSTATLYPDDAYDGKGYGRDPDVIIICYDIGDRRELEAVRYLATSLHTTIILTSNQPLTILLLGLKRDVRNHPLPNTTSATTTPTYILPSEGLNLAQSLSLVRYMECSSHTGEFLVEVSEDIIDEGVKRRMGEVIDRGEDRGGMMEGCCVG